MKKRILSVLLIICFVFFSGISVIAANNTNTEIQNPLPVSFYNLPPSYLYALFDDILDLYVQDHLYEFTREEVLEKMMKDMISEHPEFYKMFINSLLGTMDPYSSFHDASSGYMSSSSDNDVYGIVVQETDSSVIITKVIPDSSAEKAGLVKGDKIISVSGINVADLPWNVTARIMSTPYIYISDRNENGKYDNYNPEIEVTVDRNGESVSVKMSKAPADANELSKKIYEEEGVAYVAISSFVNPALSDEFSSLINEISESGIEKIIIDLRNNAGGSLELALNMSEIFVKNGALMCYGNSKDLDIPRPVYSDTPAVEFESISVLINGNTASAAELMASILRNCAGAILVGETSFGKAIGQTVYGIATGDSITITTYEMLDANGESYNGIGLVPDLEIKNVHMLYDFPKLEYFNHVNYKEIEPGVYSEACLALEKRLFMLDLLREKDVDGIWTENTKTAVMILQRYYTYEGDGTLDDGTVSIITDLINSYKTYTYYEDSQFDVALIYHSSLSQAKRLLKEKEDLRVKQQKLIKENEAYYENLED